MTLTADPQRGHIGIELDRPRVLIFDNRATWALMEKYGPSFFAELYDRHDGKALRVRSMSALTYFLWVGLQRDAEEAGETLDMEEVAEFIRPLTVQPIFNALLVALTWTPSERKRGNEDAAPASPVDAAKAAVKGKSLTGRRPKSSRTALLN